MAATTTPQAIRVSGSSGNGTVLSCLYRPIKVEGGVVDSHWFRLVQLGSYTVPENGTSCADAA
jgi:hypothetical protein